MRREFRCKKCRKLQFIATSEAQVSGIEIKCTRCKNINSYTSQDGALSVNKPKEDTKWKNNPRM
jgi:phage FluMu protein Com